MKKLLVIAYHFPPIGGAGVQRTIKFLKYLPELGFLPVIATGPGASNGRWTPKDKSLMKEIPRDVIIYRIDKRLPPQKKRLELKLEKWLMFPSHFEKWWYRETVKIGQQICSKENIEAIYVSMSPYEGAKIADHLSKEFKIPWVADLRDPWALDEMRIYPTFIHRMVDKRRMQNLLSTASAIAMNTPEATSRLKKDISVLRNNRVITLTNGFDSDDFHEKPAKKNSVKFKIVHSGYLHTELGFSLRRKKGLHSFLGGARQGVDILTRSHVFLLEAIRQLITELPDCANDIELCLVGKTSEADRTYAKESDISHLVSFTGYLPHRESLQLVRSSNLLFLPMHNLPSEIRATIVPGKTYEYMASGVPILAAVPEGDAKDFLTQSGTAFVCNPDDVVGMVHILKDQYKSWKNGQETISPDLNFIKKFERKNLTKLLAAELNKVLGLTQE